MIVVSPLNALIENQISRLSSSGIRASASDVQSSRNDDVGDSESESICDLTLCDKEKFETGYYNIVFAHPESLVSCTHRMHSLHAYQENVCAIVVDEAHCILDW